MLKSINSSKRRYGAQPIFEKLFQGLGAFPNKKTHVGPMVHCLPSMFTYEGKKMHCGPRRAQLAKDVFILASVQGTFGFTQSGPFGALLAKYVSSLGKRAAPPNLERSQYDNHLHFLQSASPLSERK